MYSFIIKVKPKSYNSWGSASVAKKTNYRHLIESSFNNAYPGHIPLDTDLYGSVYHFFQRDIGIDADNLSKPIWDCLREILFDDDKRVKMRVAGSFDLTTNDFTILDFSGLPGMIIDTLLEAIETEEHVLYIE